MALARPYGIDAPIRYWGDSLGDDGRASILEVSVRRSRRLHGDAIAAGHRPSETLLALSGGGPDGAFGAGLLAGWRARGDRPRFDVISGVSTGAIIALLTLLGPDEEQALEQFYTGYRTADLFTPAPLAAIGGGSSLLDASRFNAIVDGFIDDDVVERIAAQFRAGRILLIGTTNLDAARPVIWNVTAVAASGHPRARDLIRDIVKASAAIPAVIPPVVIPVTLPDGATRDEVHVDGGATQQVMVFSPEIPIAEIDAAVGGRIDRTIYVIVNNALGKVYQPVGLDVLSIAGRAVSSLIGGSGAGDLYKIHALASRDGICFNATWIPQSFDLTPEELFDPVHMRAVYDLGYEIGLAGGAWRSHPPFFAPQVHANMDEP